MTTMRRRCTEGPNGVPCGRTRSRAEATGTNGLNFVFCNTFASSRRAVFTHAPAIYFVIFLGLMHLRPFERDVYTHIHAFTHARAHTHMYTTRNTLSFHFSPSFSSRDLRYSSYNRTRLRSCRFLSASRRNNATKWPLPGLFIG